MDPFTILSVLGGILALDDANTKSNQEIQKNNQEMKLREEKAKAERNAKYVETATNAISILSKIGFQFWQAHQQNKIARQAVQENVIESSPSQSANTAPPQLPPKSAVYAEPNFVVDLNSVQADGAQSLLSANVTDENTGRLRKYTYYIQKINDNVQNVFESVNGSEYVKVGVIDFNRMRYSDIGNSESGGKIFGDMLSAVVQQRLNSKG